MVFGQLIRRSLILAVLFFAIGFAVPSFAEPQASEALKIDEAGTYTLTGSMRGSVVVDPGDGEVTLVMDDVNISSEGAPAIELLSGDAVHIVLRRGSCNRINDSSVNDMKAAFYTKVNTTFSGEGCLGITGNAGYGIIAESASLKFEGGEYLLCADISGIKADTLVLDGGRLFVNTGSDNIVDVSNVKENGGIMQSTSATDICSICSCCGMKYAPKKNKSTNTCIERSGCTGCCMPTTNKPGFIAEGITSNSAGLLKPNMMSAAEIVFGVSENNVIIDKGGTYIISGKVDNGSITVKKGTKGVVLILHDLDLTSYNGAAICIDNDAEVQIVVEGNVVLNEKSVKSEKGAAIKAGDNTSVHITGNGSMIIKSNYDGIYMGKNSSLVIAGKEKIDITAANDGIESKGDVAVLSGTMEIAAEEDGIHADNVLTIGEDNGEGPDITVSKSREGVEGDVVNIKGGSLDITSSEDGIEAENEAKLKGAPEPSVNITGGDIEVKAEGSAIDSDGNVNLVDCNIDIQSGEDWPCIDHDSELYIDENVYINCNCEEDCNTDCNTECDE